MLEATSAKKDLRQQGYGNTSTLAHWTDPDAVFGSSKEALESTARSALESGSKSQSVGVPAGIGSLCSALCYILFVRGKDVIPRDAVNQALLKGGSSPLQLSNLVSTMVITRTIKTC